MADLIVGKDGSISVGKKKKKKKNTDLIVRDDGTITVNSYKPTQDIAPVKTTTNKKRTWFSGGAFEDDKGNFFSDTASTILGTAGDIGTNVVKGVASAGEGLSKLLVGGIAEASDFIGQDDYADKLRNRLAGKDEEFNKRKDKYFVSSNLNKVSDTLDPYSFTGEKLDDLASSVGNLGASAAGQMVGIPWYLTMGGSSAGNELENAYSSGATSGEAWTSAAISGLSEVIFEKLSGGIKFGGKTLDEGVKKFLTNKIANKTTQTLAKFGIDALGEGTEEVLTEITSNIGKKLTYEDEKTWKEALASEEALDNYLESFIGGAVIGGGFNVRRTVNSIKTGRDYDTGLTQNEQKVYDKELESRITEAEANGKKLTNKQKTAIENQVKEDLQKGYISTSRIESTLGDNTYNQIAKAEELQEEINKLENKSLAEMTIKDKERLDSIREQVKTIDTKSLRNQLNAEIEAKIKNDGLLQGSYIEKSKRTKTFQADLTKYDEKQQKVIQKAIDSGILNDTNKTHEFVDMVAKISADKGVSFDFANNKKLKDSGFSVQGKNIDGFVNENGITLNIESNNALNKVVGHEITHVLEGTDLYTELQTAVKEYATTKGEWDKRIAEISERYKDVDGANFENELTSDLVGEYLFTDADFVNNLSTTKPNVFKKVYEEIKYLLKVATAGSKEARQLEKVKRTFDKAYKNNNVASKETNTKFSIKNNQVKDLNENQQKIINGELEVYHGTDAVFTDMQSAKGKGMNFYSTNPRISKTYSKTGNVNSYKIKMNNPLVVEGEGNIYNHIPFQDGYYKTEQIANWAKENGYDGVVFKNIIDQGGKSLSGLPRNNESRISDVFVTFDSSQSTEIERGIKYSLSEKGTLQDNNGNDVTLETSDTGTHGTLMAIHNLTETKLKGILELGGFPVPSIAIMNPSMTNLDYGDISVLFDKNTIDPSNKNNEVYGSDVYSPRFPQTVQKVNTKELSKLEKYIGKDLYLEDTTLEETVQKNRYTLEFINKFAEENNITVADVYKDSGFNYTFSIDENVRNFVIENDITYERLLNNKELRNKFYDLYKESSPLKGLAERKIETFEKIFNEQGNNNNSTAERLNSDFNAIKNGSEKIKDDFATEKALRDKVLSEYEEQYTNFLTDKLTPVFEDKYIRNNKDLYTPAGNRRSFNQLYNSYTLDNVVKEMKGKVRGEEGFFYGAGNIRSQVTPQFKSIAEIKANESKLVTNSEMEQIKQEIDTELHKLNEYASSYGREYANSFPEALNEISKLKKINYKNAKNILEEYGYDNVPDILVDKSIEFLEKLKNAPTEYFEAKPQRAVGLDEVQAIIVPNRISAELKQQLIDNGLNVIEYDPKVTGDKQNKINQFDDLKFSLSNANENIAPTGNYNVYGEDVKLQVEEAIAPLQEKIETLTEQLDTVVNSTEQLQAIQEQPYYHGTRGDFDTFDNSKIGQNYEDEWSSLGKGFYFTNDYNSAKEFGKASTNEGQVTVKEAKLDIQNPFYVEDITKNNKQTIDNMINKYELGDISNGYNLIDTLKKKGLDSTEVLKEYGYDGIIAEDEVMVFDANQIQTNNNSSEQQNEEIAPTKQEVKENIRNSLVLTKKQTSDIYKSIMGIEDFTLEDVKDAISEHSEFVTKMTDENLKELKKTIRNTKLDISYLKSIDRTFKDYVKQAFGSMRLGNSGTQIDSFYQEMSDLYPDLLPKDIINEHDQFIKLLEVSKTDENTYTTEEVPAEYMEEIANSIYNDLKSMNTIPKSNEIAPIRNDIAESSINTPVAEKVAENVQKTSVEDNQNLSVKESNQLKLQNYERLLKQNELNAKKSWNQLNELITEKMNDYKAKKNKNTKAANNILQQIYNLQAQRDNIQIEYKRKINNLEKRIEKMNTKEFKRVEQRMSKLEEYRNKFRDLIGDTSTWKDKKLGIQYQINTLQRNLRDIVRDRSGKRNIELADTIYNELQGKYNEHEAQLKVEGQKIKDFYQKMNINKWEDPYIQMLGEYNYNPDTTLLAKQINEYYEAHKDKIDVEKVKKVIEYARKTYDNLFTRVNEVLKAQGMKEIPYRQGYFPHFVEEKQGLLAKIFDWKVRDDNIPTDIAGTTENFNPERSWQSFNKHREGDSTTYSFTKGLDNYVSGALDWIYHIEDIQKRRAFENEIRWQHSDEGIKERIQEIYNNPEYDADEIQEQIDLIYSVANNPLNNFVVDFRNATNNLAGKKSTADRTLEYATNRKVYSTMTNISNRVSGNMIGGSISAALSNFIPITQSWGEVSPYQSLKAAKETMQSIIKDDGTIDKSVFLTNRLRKVDNLYKTAWDKVGDKMGIVFESVDNFTAQVVWRSKYNQNIQQGMSETEAIRNADRFAENVIAGRSKGNMPTIFNSKNPLIKMLTSFQVEVNNQYGYMFKDLPQDIQNKSKTSLVKSYLGIFLGAYAYNSLYSALVGRDVAFDPIAIIGELLKGLADDEEEDKLEVLKDFGEDVAQNIPFLGGLIGGGRVPISAMLPYDNPVKTLTGTIEDVSKLTDPEKREEALKNLTSEWLNPVTYLALPFGGGQIRKTIEGLSMYDDDLPIAGNYTNSGDLRYTADESLGGIIKSALFGKWASKEAQEYIDSGFKTVSKDNVQEMLDLGMNTTEYRKLQEGITEAGKTTDKKGYKKYLDSNDNVYWYDKENQTVYDSDYEEVDIPIVDLEKASSTGQKMDYINELPISNDKKNILYNSVVPKTTTDQYGYEKYIGIEVNSKGKLVEKTYWYDSKNDTLYDSKYNEVSTDLLDDLYQEGERDMSDYNDFEDYEEFDFANENPDKYNFLQENNISYKEYNASSESREAYNWAYNNPEKYEVTKLIGTLDEYVTYKDAISEIKEAYTVEDYDNLTSKQKTALSKQRKAAVQYYIQSLSLDIPQKLMLEKLAGGYSIKSYERYMYGYIESLEMTAEEKQAIHKELFK